MEAEARVIVGQALAADAKPVVRRSAQMRYQGQGHEIEVAFTDDPRDPSFGTKLKAAFEAAYAAMYGMAVEGNAVEATSWTVKVQEAGATPARQPPRVDAHSAAATGTRRVFDGGTGAWQSWPEYGRAALRPGAHAPGPAIVTEDETTTVVPAGFQFSIGGEGYIWLIRQGGDA